MAENKIKREAQTREADKRKPAWQKPQTLPDPEPKPGFVHRWIRISTLNVTDASNISSKIREGWVPAKASEYPEMQLLVTDASEKFKDNIVIGGLLLCVAPEELAVERNRHYQGQTDAQMMAVDNNYMSDDDPRMKKFATRKSEVSFGNGT